MAAGGELGRCPEAPSAATEGSQDEFSGLLRSDPRVARLPDGAKRFRPAVGLAAAGAFALVALTLIRGGSAPSNLRRSAGGFERKDEDQSDKACCSEYRVECLACMAGETPEEYCKHPDEDGVTLCKRAYSLEAQEEERQVLLHALSDLMDLDPESEHEMTAQEKEKYEEEKKKREEEERRRALEKLSELKKKHEEEAEEEGQRMVRAWDKEKEELDKGHKPTHEVALVPSNASGPSMYCFALMMPFGYEPSLLATQRMRGISIFACDEWQVYSNETSVLVGDGQDGTRVPSPVPITIVKESLSVSYGGRWWTALNTGVFNRLWQEVLKQGRYRQHDWVVKVDPDAVFFPNRLRSLLARTEPMRSLRPHGKAPDQLKCGVCAAKDKQGTTCFAHVRSLQAEHGCSKALQIAARPTSEDGCDCSCDDFACDLPDEAMYLNNCKYGLHGPIEVFSRRAVAMYVAGLPKCVELMGNPWGEDKFMDQCMMKLGIKRVDQFNLLSETACGEQPAPCGSDDVAFHPFKSIPSYFSCWAYADKYGNWTEPEAPEKQEPRRHERGGHDEAEAKVSLKK